MEAYTELEPANMDFAMADGWPSVQDEAAEFANTELDFPVPLHATTDPFPADHLVDELEDRLTDADVNANPVFAELLQAYRAHRPKDLADTQQVRFFLGVDVDMLEVYRRYDTEPTPSERLTEFPVIGFPFNPFVTRRDDYDADERRQQMFADLEDRIRTVLTELIDSIPGWSSHRLSTLDLVLLSTEFWNGTELQAGGAERLIRSLRALHRQPRGEHE